MLNTLRRAARFYRINKKIPSFSGAWFLSKKPSVQPVDYDKIAWVEEKLFIKDAGLSLTKKEFDYFYNDLAWVINFFSKVTAKREGEHLIATVMGKDSAVKILIDRREVVAIINELFLEEGYRTESSEKFIVIDIGMNVGLATLYFASDNKVSRVFSFEPFPETFEAGLLNFSLNPELQDKITPFNVGLGASDTILKVPFDSESVLTSSTTGMVTAKTSKYIDVKIQNASFTIKNLIETYFSSHKILFKVDCEGAEYEIMEDLQRTGLLNRIDAIIMEWHVKGAEPIIDILNKNGFLSYTRKLPHEFPIGLIYATKY